MNGGTPFCPRKRPAPSLRGYNLGASAGRERCQPTILGLPESCREPAFLTPTSVTTPADWQRPPDFSRRTALSTESVQEPAATTISAVSTVDDGTPIWDPTSLGAGAACRQRSGTELDGAQHLFTDMKIELPRLQMNFGHYMLGGYVAFSQTQNTADLMLAI